MSHGARILITLLTAILTLALPCSPAFARADTCAMAGCDPSPVGNITSTSCCCSSPASAAQQGASTALSGVFQKLAPAVAAWSPEFDRPGLLLAAGLFIEPPAPVPLYLLNASLLI